MSDAILLKTCETKDNYYLVRKHIKVDLVSRETYDLLEAIGEYYEKHSDTESLDYERFLTWFLHCYKPDMKPKEAELYKLIIQQVKTTSSSDINDLLKAYQYKDKKASVIDAFIRNKPIEEIQNLLVDSQEVKQLDCEVDMSNLDAVLEATDRSKGLHWRLECLNYGFKPLIKGDFVVIGARPDTGKTGFLCSEVSHMATQLEEGKQILWFNNEGEPRELIVRIYQSLLNEIEPTIRANKEQTLEQVKTILGNINKIKVFHVIRYSYRELEAIIKRYNPGLIVIDMLDHVKGFKSFENEPSDVKFVRLYQWARDLSTIYCPILATSQVPANNFDSRYPPMEALMGSGTAKQAAAHDILMIGREKDTDNNTRYLSAPKNKINAQSGYFKYQCQYDKDHQRFI
jgi:replicative DNA helicase